MGEPRDEGDPAAAAAGAGAGGEGREDDGGRLRQRIEAALPEAVRRALSGGIGRIAAELPKEVAHHLIGQAQAGKDELLRVVANELRRFLDRVDLSDTLARALSTLTLEIKTEIRFHPNPDVKRRVSVRRRRDDEPGGEPGAGG